MVQKKSIRMFWPVFLCCLLTACASNTGQPPLSTHTPSIQPSLTTPIATVTPTAYPSSTVTPTCTATPTQIPSITLYPTKETPSITPTLAPFPPVVNDLAYLASGQMAFISVGDNEKCGGLGVIDADGSNPKRYERPTVPVSIAWSPDGQWLAYEEFLYSMGHHEDIFLIQPNGNTVRHLIRRRTLRSGIR